EFKGGFDLVLPLTIDVGGVTVDLTGQPLRVSANNDDYGEDALRQVLLHLLDPEHEDLGAHPPVVIEAPDLAQALQFAAIDQFADQIIAAQDSFETDGAG